MKSDRSIKILLSSITFLLCVNLLIALRVSPTQAQQANIKWPRYQVYTSVPTPGLSGINGGYEGWTNEKATDGYRFKGIAASHDQVVLIMEK